MVFEIRARPLKESVSIISYQDTAICFTSRNCNLNIPIRFALAVDEVNDKVALVQKRWSFSQGLTYQSISVDDW